MSGKFSSECHWVGLLLAFVSSCAISATVVDDTGRSIEVKSSTPRIVSIAPGATEMLFAAGAGERIVATVEYSDEPDAARKVPRIGDSNSIDVERLMTLRPDVVVVWDGGNNPAQIAKIEALRIPVYRHQLKSLADIPRSLRRLGKLAGTQSIANAKSRELEQKLTELQQRYASRKSINVMLQVWNHPIYTVGGSHIMSDGLRLCGAKNVFADLREQGPAVEIEAVVARNPDVIVAVAESVSGAEWLDQWRRFAGLRAVRFNNLIDFPDRRLSRLGPSVFTATESLCEVLDQARTRSGR